MQQLLLINLVKTLHSKQPLKQLLKLKFFKNFNINTKQGYAFQMINKYHFEPQWKWRQADFLFSMVPNLISIMYWKPGIACNNKPKSLALSTSMNSMYLHRM